MLPAENRLTKVRDFNLLMKHGRWINGGFVDLKYLPLAKVRNFFPKRAAAGAFEKQLKIAFAIGTKVSKSAVKRNRVKRQMREAARLLLKDNQLRTGHYLLFAARPAILEKEYAEISGEMKLLLEKARILG